MDEEAIIIFFGLLSVGFTILVVVALFKVIHACNMLDKWFKIWMSTRNNSSGINAGVDIESIIKEVMQTPEQAQEQEQEQNPTSAAPVVEDDSINMPLAIAAGILMLLIIFALLSFVL